VPADSNIENGIKIQETLIQPSLWEKVIIWLIFAIVILLTTIPQVIVTANNWEVAKDGFLDGTIPLVSLILPIVILVAAILLIRLNSWSLALFIVHFLGSLLSITYYYDIKTLSWLFAVGYILELFVIYFVFQLWGRRVLK
jgi:hypothetical protein